MSTGAGQGSAAPLLAITNTERWLERLSGQLDQLLGRSAGPVVGKGVKVSEPAAEPRTVNPRAPSVDVDAEKRRRSRTRTRVQE